jgi:hypothetical protein
MAYNNFVIALRGEACSWLFSFIDTEDFMADQPLRTTFRLQFLTEFTIQSNDRPIIEELSNLAMKSGETTRELLNRVTYMMVIIKES